MRFFRAFWFWWGCQVGSAPLSNSGTVQVSDAAIGSVLIRDSTDY